MTNKLFLATMLSTFFSFSAFSQAHLRVSDISIQAGGSVGTNQYSSNVNLLPTAQSYGSTILNGVNLSGYNKYSYSEPASSSMFSILLGTEVSFPSKLKMNIRGGFTALSNSAISNGYYKQDVYRVDTLTSSQTGQQIYIDSFQNDSYHLSNNMQQLGLDLSVTFSTNKLNKFSFYTGAGMLFGITYANFLDIYHTNYASGNGFYGYGNNMYNNRYYSSYNGESETIKLSNNGSTIAVFIPIGIEYRISKKIKVLKNFSYYMEMRPAFVMSNNNFTQRTSSITWMNFSGLRYHIR